MSRKRLILQADDFGMCPEVNEGILRGFRDGIVTQASTMVPCPAIEEAIALAREHAIPIGVHGTLTSEWDFLRWRPLTAGSSLCEPDGTMHRTLEAARARLEGGEAASELIAQTERLRETGLHPVYLDCHMGPSSLEGFEQACRETGLPFLYPLIEGALELASIAMMSDVDAREKKHWLLDTIDGLGEGVHLIVSHPAIDSPELRAISRPEAENYRWVAANRTSDLEVLLDPDIRKQLVRCDVELVSVADL